MTPSVFLSHSSKNGPVADTIRESLEAHGIQCWISSRDISPGANWGEAIIDGINQSKVMIVILTEESNSSQHVMREVERAVNNDISIIPMRIEDFPLSKSLEYFLSSANWLDAFTPPLKSHLDTLATRVTNLLAGKGGVAATAPASKAPQKSGPTYLQRVRLEADKKVERVKAEGKKKAAVFFAKAKEYRAAFNYPSAIESIQAIPNEMRNPEMVAYLRRLELDRDESERLLALIKTRIETRQVTGLISDVKQAIELRGDRKDLIKLLDQLKDQGQAQGGKALKKQSEQKVAAVTDPLDIDFSDEEYSLSEPASSSSEHNAPSRAPDASQSEPAEADWGAIVAGIVIIVVVVLVVRWLFS
jgi:hypothetical protein